MKDSTRYHLTSEKCKILPGSSGIYPTCRSRGRQMTGLDFTMYHVLGVSGSQKREIETATETDVYKVYSDCNQQSSPDGGVFRMHTACVLQYYNPPHWERKGTLTSGWEIGLGGMN